MENVGIDQVRGAATTHYRAATDLSDSAAVEGPRIRETFETLSKKMDGEDTLTVDM